MGVIVSYFFAGHFGLLSVKTEASSCEFLMNVKVRIVFILK